MIKICNKLCRQISRLIVNSILLNTYSFTSSIITFLFMICYTLLRNSTASEAKNTNVSKIHLFTIFQNLYKKVIISTSLKTLYGLYPVVYNESYHKIMLFVYRVIYIIQMLTSHEYIYQILQDMCIHNSILICHLMS